jgi:proteasome assembly chaperone (PAC2) family protein
VGVRRILFVGSFGGSVPHTREPRMFISCSDAELLPQMEAYGVRPSNYEGPGSFTTYLMQETAAEGFQMVSLVAEIPGYLQGTNPLSIEAVSRRLAKILKLPLEIDSLRVASTEWELKISSIIENDKDFAEKVRQLEDEYDNELLEHGAEEG